MKHLMLFLLTSVFCLGVCSTALAVNFAVKCLYDVNTELGDLEAAILCSGAKSKAPQECYHNVFTELGDLEAAINCTKSGRKWEKYW